MLSRRLPHDREPNAWAKALAALKAAGRPLLDLTESNPTRVGLAGAGDAELAALADPRGARYEPDPRGLASARAAVAAAYAARGIAVEPSRLVLTSGTSESYAHLLRLLANPGDAILVPTPSYPLLEPLATLEDLSVVPYRIAYDGRWHLDLGSLEAALATPRARALVVVEPNHPTGSCLDPDERAALESLCERHGVALIADEVFGEFPWGPAPLPSFAGARRVPTFVLGGLSKSCGMPQLKLGWIAVAGSAPECERAVAGLEWIADLFLSVATPVQLALPRLLESGVRFRALARERIAANRAALAALVRARPAIEVLHADGGWVAIVRLPSRASGEEWSLALLARDVVVHPGHFYDLPGEAYLVVSLIPEVDRFARALDRLADVVAG